MATEADPCLAYMFAVTLDGNERASLGFSEVGGLGFEFDVETVREGGFNGAERQLLGIARYPARLVLKRGLAPDSDMWSWYLDVMRGCVRRRELTIELRTTHRAAAGAAPMKWTFLAACPVKWVGPAMQASSSAVAFEQIEFVHQGFKVPPPPPATATRS